MVSEEVEKGQYQRMKVLATLYEQKVCDFRQIVALCLNDISNSSARKLLSKMKKEGLIDATLYPRVDTMPINLYNLTPYGLQRMLDWKCSHLQDHKQIKSNYIVHDIALTDIRIAFQKFTECQFYVSENVLRLKILEESSSNLANVRTANADAAVLLDLKGTRTWSAVEYENTLKSDYRYSERFKKWYANSDLWMIMMISATQQIQNKLQELEKVIYPNLKRKILFATCRDLISVSSTTTFSTTNGIQLSFHKDGKSKMYLPALNPTIA